MAVDPRQVVAGFLTFSMFAMLANMIKTDHFDSIQITIQETSSGQFDVLKLEEKAAAEISALGNGPLEDNSQGLKSCWSKPDAKRLGNSKGYVTFSLTNGPEFHISQVTDAVVVARYLGATLVLPDIRGTELGQKRNFEDMYDSDKFIQSLDGVVKIVKDVPEEMTAMKPAVVRIPNRVSRDFIEENVEPIFQASNYLRLATFFPSINLKRSEKRDDDLDSTSCLAMFGSLELKMDITEVANRMVDRLKALSRSTNNQFIAVDLRIDILENKHCQKNKDTGRKICYNVQEIAEFLKKVGYSGDNTIYLTQTWWHESLNPLKEIFPKTYTKDDIIPADKKGYFLRSGSAELERALDFYICSKSEVFVPAISGLFYGNVAGKRIASGKTQILVPSQVTTSSTASDFLSSYVSKKSHLAYSCYC